MVGSIMLMLLAGQVRLFSGRRRFPVWGRSLSKPSSLLRRPLKRSSN